MKVKPTSPSNMSNQFWVVWGHYQPDRYGYIEQWGVGTPRIPLWFNNDIIHPWSWVIVHSHPYDDLHEHLPAFWVVLGQS